mmetsp:Transcript_26632/g.60785  ORF Transcript_26632/g.60785 Transcript_26632/m.60785 type:complete len:212 (-) Transcript_26632:463-1098(-)
MLKLMQSRLHYQPLGVNKPASPLGLILGHTLRYQLLHNEISDSSSSLPCPVEQEQLILQLGALHACRTQESCQGDRRSSLNVVVERADAMPVLLKELERRGVPKVFKLDQHPREVLMKTDQHFFHELHVLLSSHTGLFQARVVGIVDQTLSIRSHIHSYGQTAIRVDATACSVQIQLANWNSHPIRAQVSQTQYPLSISDHDDVHLLRRPI